MHPVGGVRQEGRHHRVEVRDRLHERVQHRGEALLLVVPLELEGLRPRHVGVRLADDPHHLGERRLLPVPLEGATDGLEAGRDGGEQLLVDGLDGIRRGDLTEVLRDHRGGAVDEVAPARDELAVVALDELGPAEVGVLVLRARGADEVADRVGPVARDDVLDVDDVLARGGELGALERHELARDDLRRQSEHAVGAGLAPLVALAGVGEQLGRPDLRVEGDVVLALEVVGPRLRVVPPLPPPLGLAAAPGPLDGGGEVADDGVEPHVEPLARVVLPALERDRDPPVDVAAHRARAHVLEQVLGELDDVGPPGARRLAPVEPLLEGAGEGGQVEEEVLGLDELGGLAVDLAAGVDELVGVELVAAVVALVAAGLGEGADRAGALDVAVGQGAPGRRADRTARRLLDHVAVGVDLAEHLLDDGVVVARRRAGEQVVGQAEVGEVLGDDRVVLVDELLWRQALLVGEDEDRGAVLVRARDHQHVVAGHPHVPAEDVGGHTETGHVADVARAVGVRPGDGRQDFAHGPDPRWTAVDVAPGFRRPPAVVRVRAGAESSLGEVDLEGDRDGLERLAHGAALLRGLGGLLELLGGHAGHLGRDRQRDAGDARAGLEADGSRGVDRLGRGAGLGEPVGQGHRVARRVGRRDELLGARETALLGGAGGPRDVVGAELGRLEGDLAGALHEGALPVCRGVADDSHVFFLPWSVVR